MNTDDKVRRLVDQAVTAAVPPDGIVQRRLLHRPDSDYTWPAPAPLAGLRAAQQVIKLAEVHLYQHVVGLRGEGTSWREIADLLDIPWGEGYSQVERAFELVGAAVGLDSGRSGTRLYWYCGGPDGCGLHITDHGPYEGWPADNEAGHADGCRRLAAQTAAQERANEDAERRAQVKDEAYELLLPGSFARLTADRARDVVARGGRYRGWSTGESLAVALALNDDAALKLHGYPDRAAAIARVGASLTGDPHARVSP